MAEITIHQSLTKEVISLDPDTNQKPAVPGQQVPTGMPADTNDTSTPAPAGPMQDDSSSGMNQPAQMPGEQPAQMPSETPVAPGPETPATGSGDRPQ